MKKKRPQPPQPKRSNSKSAALFIEELNEPSPHRMVQSRPEPVIGTIATMSVANDDTVLYIATNASQIEMACIMSEHSRFKSIIYSDGFDFYELSTKYFKASFCNSLKNAAAILKHITKVVTYIGQVNPNIKKDYRSLLSSALKLSIPIIELPHGLIQSGYNLNDSSRLIDLSSYYNGIGNNLPSIASMRLRWHGSNSVGYPRHLGAALAPRVLPNYTVITTNTNWFLYTIEEKRNFFKIVFRFAEANPERMFIWSPHPAETNEQTFSHSISALRPANVMTYGLKHDIYFDGIENSNDLIAYCENGISSITTCLLEYEIHGKDVTVYSTDGVANLISSFTSVKTFRSLVDISEPGTPITTGMLELFNPERFDEYLMCASNSEPRNSIYLEIV